MKVMLDRTEKEKKSSAIKQFNVICSTTSTAIICDGFPSVVQLSFLSRCAFDPEKTLFALFLGGLKVMDSGQLFIDDVSLVARLFSTFSIFVFVAGVRELKDIKFSLFSFDCCCDVVGFGV